MKPIDKKRKDFENRLYGDKLLPDDYEGVGELVRKNEGFHSKHAEQNTKKSIWARIVGRANDDGVDITLNKKPAFMQVSRADFIKYAAAVLILMIIGAGFFYRSMQNASRWSVVENPTGKILSVKLPDGSKIWLNADSKVSFPERFGDTREVKLLEGEAYFEVTHDKKHPFIIHFAGMKTKVLGTSFTIKAYKELPNVQVIVSTGKVAVADSLHTYGILTSYHQLTIEKTSGKAYEQVLSTAQMPSLKEGKIVLNDVSYKELALILSKTYNLTITFKNQTLKNCHISFSFDPKEDIKRVLGVLQIIHRIDYEMQGNHLIISGYGCN